MLKHNMKEIVPELLRLRKLEFLIEMRIEQDKNSPKYDVPTDWRPTDKEREEFMKTELKFSSEPLETITDVLKKLLEESKK